MNGYLMYPVLMFLHSFSYTLPYPQNYYGSSENDCLTDTYPADQAPVNLASILDFEINVFKKLAPENGSKDFVLSPYSLWNVLTMAYFGASSTTEKELKAALGLKDKKTTYNHLRTLQLDYRYRLEKEGNHLEINNNIYFDQSVHIRYCMEGILHKEIQSIDFSNPKAAAARINGDVSKATHGKIKSIVTDADVTGVLFTLLNTAYFVGSWKYPFDPEETAVRNFHKIDGTTIPVNMMSLFGEFNSGYSKALDSFILELPYVGNSMAMYLLKPRNPGQAPFNHLIDNFTRESLLEAIKETWPTHTEVQLPRFKMQTRITDELIEAMKQLGITEAFHPNSSDFSDFSNIQVYLQKGITLTNMEVNEKTTSAESVSVFISTKIGGTSNFHCDRPFLYLVYDKRTTNILFMGLLSNPPPVKGKVRNDLPINNNYYPQQQQQIYNPASIPQQHIGVSGQQSQQIEYSSISQQKLEGLIRQKAILEE